MRVAHGLEPLWRRPDLFIPAAAAIARVHARRRRDARARHRRQQRDLRAGRRRAAAPAAVPGPRSAGHRSGRRSERSAHAGVSPLNMTDWNERSRTFESIAGFMPNIGGMVMNSRDGAAETVTRQWVTAGFFDAIGVKAIAGRTLSARRSRGAIECRGLERGAVAGTLRPRPHRRRPRHPPRRHDVHGRGHRAQGLSAPRPHQHVGDDRLRSPADAAARLRSAPSARMKPGVTIEAARAEMTTIAEGLAQEFPDTNTGRRVTIEPMHDALIGGELRTTSLLFLGVVGFVLADLLRQRRQPAADARHRADARVRHPLGARRQPAACDPPARHREPAARGARRRARRRRRRRDSAQSRRR